jgi:hypothetical protein
MMKDTKKLWLCLLVIAISLLASGCGGGSSSSNEGAPAIVTVIGYSGIRVPEATVVLGDGNGVMKAYGVTDAKGQITFKNAPANATVTAAITCLRSGATTTTYSINVEYDVNGSAVLSLDNCADPSIVYPGPGPALELGTVTVNVTNMPGDVTQNQMTVGRHIFVGYGSLITTQTVTITENDLDSDGTFSIIVIGRDINYNTVAYGILLDQIFTDGMTIDIQMGPMSFVQYQISNIPATAVTLQPSMSIYRTGLGFGSDHHPYSFISAPSSTTIDVAYIPGFGNQVSYQIEVGLDQDRDGVADSYQSLRLESSVSVPSNQSFDLSKALPAPYVTVAGADTATPTLSWSGADPAATSIYIGASLRSSTTNWYLSPGNLMRSRSSIRYPELPDSLAAFRPNNVDYFFVYTSAFEGNLNKTSYGSYQTPIQYKPSNSFH